jgi:hypothetical protein
MRSALFYYCLAQTRAPLQDRRTQHDPPARVRTTRRALSRRRRGSSSSGTAAPRHRPARLAAPAMTIEHAHLPGARLGQPSRRSARSQAKSLNDTSN